MPGSVLKALLLLIYEVRPRPMFVYLRTYLTNDIKVMW